MIHYCSKKNQYKPTLNKKREKHIIRTNQIFTKKRISKLTDKLMFPLLVAYISNPSISIVSIKTGSIRKNCDVHPPPPLLFE